MFYLTALFFVEYVRPVIAPNRIQLLLLTMFVASNCFLLIRVQTKVLLLLLLSTNQVTFRCTQYCVVDANAYVAVSPMSVLTSVEGTVNSLAYNFVNVINDTGIHQWLINVRPGYTVNINWTLLISANHDVEFTVSCT